MLRFSSTEYGCSSLDNLSHFFSPLQTYPGTSHPTDLKLLYVQMNIPFCFIPECCASILDCILCLFIYALIQNNLSHFRIDLY